MEESVTRGLFNLESLNEAAKDKVQYIDFNQIKTNSLNSIYQLNDIDDLKESFKSGRFREPITVHKNADGSYRIISGHRRYAACMKLFDEGYELSYREKTLFGKIPCLIDYEEYEDEDDEMLAIIESNQQRIKTSEEKYAEYRTVHEIYERKCAKGEKPPGKEGVYIGKQLKVSSRTVQTYKSKVYPEKVQKQNKKKKNNKQRIIKMLGSIEKEFTDFELEEYSDEEVSEIKETAIPAISIVLQRLGIDVDGL